MELILILLALACAPYMLARMLRLPAPPSPAELWAAVSPAVGPAIELLGYLVKRAIAFGWEPTEEELPRLLRPTRYVVSESGEITPDGQTDGQTDPVSAPDSTIARLELDRTRAAVIDVLVQAGWDVGRIRATLKGDNGAIGTEVAAARERFGLDTPSRTIGVSDRQDGQTIRREIRL